MASLIKQTYLYKLPQHLVKDIFTRYVGCANHLDLHPDCRCGHYTYIYNHITSLRCNYRVIIAWILHKSFKTANLRTDGHNLYSYALLIGMTDEKGRKVLYEYTAKGIFISMTTSFHVNKARSHADRIQIPCYDDCQ